jgi:hypothetical protein
MTKAKMSLAFLLLAPMAVLSSGCDRMIDGITSGEPPPCVIAKGAQCEPPPPPQPPVDSVK